MVAETYSIHEHRPQPVESLSGTVEHVVTFAADSGWGVYRIRTEVSGRRDDVVVVGHGGDLRPGVFIAADGRWERGTRFGDRFKADVIRLTPPSTTEGILKYLASGMIRGIGPKKATAIVAAFGVDTFDVIENHPTRLSEVKGVSLHLQDTIRQAWGEHATMRDLMVFLQRYGISTTKAAKIFKKYGNDSISTITADPFILAKDIDGIGFASADKAAEQLGIPRTSFKRVSAGLIHSLEELKGEGHSAAPRELLLGKAVKLLGLEPDLVDRALSELTSFRELIDEQVRGRPLIYLPYMRQYEVQVTRFLRALTQGSPKSAAINFPAELARAEEATKKKLSDGQRDALRQAMQHRVQVITGGPGAGKSTILHTLLEMLVPNKLRVQLCAPTGRAAKRMEELTGRTATTIHRLLEYKPFLNDFARNQSNPLDGDVFICDESSMLDLSLAYKFFRAIPPHAQLILIGDVDQLPSVGAGSVLADIIQSNAIPVVWLHEIFRQAKSSKIIINAHAVNAGQMPTTDNNVDEDFFFVKLDEAEAIKRMILKIVTERIPTKYRLDPMKDVQVLAPMHKGPLGIGELNKMLQRALNGANMRGPKHTLGFHDYYVGDKVMQLKNDYDLDVFNGDLGYIRSIDTTPGKREAIIDFDGRNVTYPLNKFTELTLAYSCSIHKSQGGEWPAVIMPLVKGYYHMLQKNLIYTGMTRGKRLVVMIGEKAALGMAVRNNKANERHGGLMHRLTQITDDWGDDTLLGAA